MIRPTSRHVYDTDDAFEKLYKSSPIAQVFKSQLNASFKNQHLSLMSPPSEVHSVVNQTVAAPNQNKIINPKFQLLNQLKKGFKNVTSPPPFPKGPPITSSPNHEENARERRLSQETERAKHEEAHHDVSDDLNDNDVNLDMEEDNMVTPAVIRQKTVTRKDNDHLNDDDANHEIEEEFSVVTPMVTRQKTITRNDINQMEVKNGNKKPKKVRENKKKLKVDNWSLVMKSKKGVTIEGHLIGESEDTFWRSTVIAERLHARKLATASGSVYHLVGDIEKEETLEEGFSNELVEAFTHGFPKDWKEWIDNHMTIKKPKKSIPTVVNSKQTQKNPSLEQTPVTKPKRSKSMGVTNTKTEYSTPKIPLSDRKKPSYRPDQSVWGDSEGAQDLDLSILPRTKSGRIVKPQLAYWIGQRVVCDPKKDFPEIKCENANALTPVVDSSNMRFLKTKIPLKSKWNLNSSENNSSINGKQKKKNGPSTKENHKVSANQKKKNSKIQSTDDSTCDSLQEDARKENDERRNMKKKTFKSQMNPEKRSKSTRTRANDNVVKSRKQQTHKNLIVSTDSDCHLNLDSKGKETRTSSMSAYKTSKKAMSDSLSEENTTLIDSDGEMIDDSYSKSLHKTLQHLEEKEIKSKENIVGKSKDIVRTQRNKIDNRDSDGNDSVATQESELFVPKQNVRRDELPKENIVETNCSTSQESDMPERNEINITRDIMGVLKKNRERKKSQPKSKTAVYNNVKKDRSETEYSSEDEFTRAKFKTKKSKFLFDENSPQMRKSKKEKTKNERVDNSKKTEKQKTLTNFKTKRRKRSVSSSSERSYNEKPAAKKRKQTVQKEYEEVTEEDVLCSDLKTPVEDKKHVSRVKRNVQEKRSRKSGNVIPTEKTKTWSDAEIQRLKQAQTKFSTDTPMYWEVISAVVKTRSAEECEMFESQRENERKAPSKKNIKTKDASQPVELTGKVGTLKRKRQLRELIDAHNQNCEDDDAWKTTPFKASVPGMSVRSCDDSWKEMQDVVETPRTERHISHTGNNPFIKLGPNRTSAATFISPSQEPVDRNAVDAYIHRTKIGTRGKFFNRSKFPANETVNQQQPKSTLDSSISIHPNLLDIGKISDKEETDNEDYYWSD